MLDTDTRHEILIENIEILNSTSVFDIHRFDYGYEIYIFKSELWEYIYNLCSFR